MQEQKNVTVGGWGFQEIDNQINTLASFSAVK